jgi:hypothetical protein
MMSLRHSAVRKVDTARRIRGAGVWPEEDVPGLKEEIADSQRE